MSYKGISARERKLIDEISKRGITLFRPIDVSNILHEPRDNAYRILSRMEDKDLVERIERGKYITKSDLERMHLYEIATKIATPSYLSLWSALHYYGYTTQVPRIVYVMATVPKEGVKIQDQMIKFVKTNHFFGYRSQNEMVIAEPEKLFIDCLLYPHYSGGINEIISSLKEAELEEETLISYAQRIGNKSLNSRLGYLMEITGKNINLDNLDTSESPVPLDPSKKSSDLNKKWNIRW